MRRRVQARIPPGRQRVPAVVCADREFSVWRRVKSAQFISAIALLFWGAVFFALFA